MDTDKRIIQRDAHIQLQMATELVRGKTLEDAWQLSNTAVAEALDGLPPIRMHCSVLAEEGIHKAINDYRVRHGLLPWQETSRTQNEHDEDVCEH
jgi:nitrogen fixation NifU-like protein